MDVVLVLYCCHVSDNSSVSSFADCNGGNIIEENTISRRKVFHEECATTRQLFVISLNIPRRPLITKSLPRFAV